jgi:hypothetical protein
MPVATQAKTVAGKPKDTNAVRLFGYDIFVSFALGPAPRGTHSYAMRMFQLGGLGFQSTKVTARSPPGLRGSTALYT